VYTRSEKAWEDIDAYFVSFTQEPGSNGDRLSQWRGYSLDHHGFSLGFNAARLKSKAEMMMDMNDKKRPSIYLLKCLYDEEKKRILSHDSVKVHWKTAVEKWEERNKNKTSLENGKSIGKELADNLEPFQENLLKFSAMFKHQGFREESEWRIVLYMHCELTNPDLIQFRDGFFGRTPFISIPLGLKDPDSPLERIVVGPAQDKEQSVARLRIDLAKLGIQGVEVVPSKIPYRNW